MPKYQKVKDTKGEFTDNDSPLLLGLLEIVSTIIIVVMFLKMFVLDFYVVQSESMEPQLKPGDLIIVSKLFYYFGPSGNIPFTNITLPDSWRIWYKQPKENDIAIIKESPYDNENSGFIIKRIEAASGDEVYSVDNNRYYRVPGKGMKVKLDELSLPIFRRQLLRLQSKDPDYFPEDSVITLESDLYFVLGDNWHNSYDSRDFGLVSKEDIVGSPILLLSTLEEGIVCRGIY